MSDPAADASAHPPLISVIVRSMDRPSLAAALASIDEQDQSPLEVLVVNALGATHGALPETVGEHLLRRVDLGRALPRSQAANAGLDAARGLWVIFLDDDDRFLPGHLSRLARALQARPDAVAAYADVAYGRQGAAGWVTEHVFAADFDPLRLRFENYLPLHAVLVDRGSEALRRCRFDPQLDLFEDWDWWLQLARVGPFVHVPGVSAQYVAAGGGGSGVFGDDATTARARDQLLRKWLALDSLDDRMALLLALQQHYRAARASAEREVARQRESLDSARHIESLHALVTSREAEIAESRRQIDDLAATLERERADWQAEQQALKEVVKARELEVDASRQHADNLTHILQARESDIANLNATLSGLLSERPLEAFTRAWRNRNNDRS